MRRALRLLISAGPTREPIDPVRFISNYSTGYMGAQLAAEALARGHRVKVISGPISEPLPDRAAVVPVETAEEMGQALRQAAGWADAIVMAAAVSDFRPRVRAVGKLRRRHGLALRLEATPDIIGRLPRRPRQVIAGFALETDQVVAHAMRKLREKRLHLLLAQQVPKSRQAARQRPGAARGAPFGRCSVQAWLLAGDGTIMPLGRRSKRDIAGLLLDKIEALWYGQHNANRRSLHAATR